MSQAYRANGTRCYPLSPICKACAENGFRTVADVEVMGEEDCKNTVIVELAKAKRAAEGVLQRRALDGADRLIPMIIGNGVCRSALDTNLRTRAQVARMPEDDCRNTVIGAIAKHMTEKDGAKAASVVPALQAKSSDELAGQWENIWWQEQQVVVGRGSCWVNPSTEMHNHIHIHIYIYINTFIQGFASHSLSLSAGLVFFAFSTSSA